MRKIDNLLFNKIMKKFIYFLLGALLCVSCIQESDPNEGSMDSDYYHVFEINVTNQDPTVDSKSILTVDPQEIKNLHVFAFDPSTKKILVYEEQAGAELKGKTVEKYVENASTISWCLPVQKSISIYAVANVGEIDTPATIDELKSCDAVKLTYNSLEEMNTIKSVPMSGVLENVTYSGSNTIALNMKSILARFDIKILFKEELADDQVVKVTVANANKSASLFSTTNAAKSASDLITGMDQTTSQDVINLNYSESITLYTLENLQTTVNGATSSASSWKEVSQSGENLDYCTKLIISTEQPDGQSDITVLYLGQNATSNFDIVRNQKKTLTINLDGTAPELFHFTDISFNVNESSDAVVNFDYHVDCPLSLLATSSFKTNDSGLTIKSVSYDKTDRKGTVTVHAGSVTKDTDVTLTFDPGDKIYKYIDYVGGKIINVPDVKKVFFNQNDNIEYGSKAFVPIRVYAEYEDGSVEDITHSSDVKFSTTKSGYAQITTTQGTLPLSDESLIVNWGLTDGFDSEGNQLPVLGIKFGNPGSATLSATYKGVKGELKVTCVDAAIIITPTRYKVWLDYNSTQSIRFTYSTNANVQLQGWKAPRAVEIDDIGGTSTIYKHCLQIDQLSSSIKTTAKMSYSDTQNSVYQKYEPYLTLTSKDKDESFILPIYYERNATHPTWGTNIRDLVAEIEVVVTNGGENGTFKGLEIVGPDRVIYGDDATYKAIASYVSSTGETYTKDVTTACTWECGGFSSKGSQRTLGEFYKATLCNQTATVKCTYGGASYTKNVLMYMYSKLRYEFINSSVKTYVKPRRDNPYENAKLYASVVDIKLKEEFYGKDDKLVETKEKNFSFDPELAKNSTLKICGLVYHNSVAFPYGTTNGVNSVTQTIWVWMGSSYDRNGFKYCLYDLESLYLTLPFYEVKPVSADQFGQKIGLFYGDDAWESVSPAMWPFSFNQQ